MRDRFEARLWADHGAQFAEDVARAINWAWRTFCTLSAIRYRAPWRESGSEAC